MVATESGVTTENTENTRQVDVDYSVSSVFSVVPNTGSEHVGLSSWTRHWYIPSQRALFLLAELILL